MKTRIGFVSNSSSTSFLIKYDENKFTKCPTCGHEPILPINLVDDSRDDRDEIICSDINSCYDYLNDELHYDSDNEPIQKTVNKLAELKDKLKSTEQVILLYLNIHGQKIRELRELIDNGLVEEFDLYNCVY